MKTQAEFYKALTEGKTIKDLNGLKVWPKSNHRGPRMTDQAKQKREELASKPYGFDGTSLRESGFYKRGFDSGYSTAMSKAQGLVDALDLTIEQLEFTQNLFSIEGLDNSVVVLSAKRALKQFKGEQDV